MEDKAEIQENLELSDVDDQLKEELQSEEEQKEEQDYLYANRFKSVEDLEKSYLEIQKAFSAKENFQRRFEDLENSVKAPEEYAIPADFNGASDDVLESTIAKAKALQLNQQQFRNLLQESLNSIESEKSKQSERENQLKSKYGEDHYGKLMNWIKSERGFTDGEISHFTDETISRLNDERSRFFNTATDVNSSSTASISKADVDRALMEFNKAERSGDRAKADKLFQRWQRMAASL